MGKFGRSLYQSHRIIRVGEKKTKNKKQKTKNKKQKTKIKKNSQKRKVCRLFDKLFNSLEYWLPVPISSCT